MRMKARTLPFALAYLLTVAVAFAAVAPPAPADAEPAGGGSLGGLKPAGPAEEVELSAEEATMDESREDAGTALVMTGRTAAFIEGSFGSKGSLISFSGGLEEEGQRARVSLEVNGVFLEATYDPGTDTLHWDGHNASLTVEDKEALVAFSRMLEQSLGAGGGFANRSVPLHERLLYARVLHWGEAPVGLPLTARTLTSPTIRQGLKFPASPGEVEKQAACQRSGEDGIQGFASCQTTDRWLEHDATTHCYMGEWIRSGPGANDCLGRCGPGCGCGWGGYTYDCADHDRCCRVHGSCLNPRDASCGDEWWEADDDTVWGVLGGARACYACRF